MSAPTTEVRARGVITIPKSVREANNIQNGQQYVVHDLGGGTLVLSPRPSRVGALCDGLRDELLARGATLNEMLEELKRLRDASDA